MSDGLMNGLLLAGVSTVVGLVVIAAQQYLTAQIRAQLNDPKTGYMSQSLLEEKFKRIDEQHADLHRTLERQGQRIDKISSSDVFDRMQRAMMAFEQRLRDREKRRG